MSTSEFEVDRAAILGQKQTVVSVVDKFLDRIEKDNARLNIFTHVDPEARSAAERIDELLGDGADLPLAGLVLGVKDVIAHQGRPLSCASRMLEGFDSLYTSTALQRLLDAGAVVIGRTNCDEFAMGSSNESSVYGPALNPHDTARVPGGSSGGSAAAVAAGMCHAALGTDTGGSIRQPASFCGVTGLKPTYGRVSRNGLVAFASSLDCMGPMAGTVEDVAAILSVMSGADPADATSSTLEVPNYTEATGRDVSRLRVGIPSEYLEHGLSTEVEEGLARSRRALEDLGVEFDEVSLPHTRYGIATYYILATAEASSNLGRYDGIRYGHRTSDGGEEDLDAASFYRRNRTSGFGAEVKRRLMLGTYVLSAGYYDMYYGRAQYVRSCIRKDFEAAFDNVDVLLAPVTPGPAFELGAKRESALEMYLDDIFTVTANLAGIPGISIPVGSDDRGLPVGVQLLGNHFEEYNLLAMASALQANIKN